MKKSNILLISILIIFILFVITITFQFKHVITKIEDNSVKLNLSEFNTLSIADGWSINLVYGEETKVSILKDSIKKYISLNNNELTFKKIESDDGNIHVDITNPCISKIKIEGNSFLKYRSDLIDTIFLIQKGNSKLTIQSLTYNEENSINRDKTGQINYACILLYNHSRFNVHSAINNLTGELKDTSRCRLYNNVAITNFSKSKTSNINSW